MNHSVAVITGVSSGMGAATVRCLAKNGFHVYGTTRDVKNYKKNNEDVKNVEVLEVDITSDASVKKAIAYIVKKENKIDLLINNAGYCLSGAVEDTPIDETKNQFEVNFFSVVRMTNMVLPLMRERGSGLIINISSIVGQMGIPFQAFYCASKYALEGFSESLRLEVKKFGIDVVMVEPADTATGFTANRVKISKTRSNNAYTQMMDKSTTIVERDELRGYSPERVADIILRIIGTKKPKARYTVGSFEQIFSMHLKKFIPFSLYEYLILDHFKLPMNAK